MLTSLMYSNEIVDKNEQYILRNYEGGEYKKVIKEAKKILKQNKDSFVANKYLGLCYSHNKKYNKANLYLKKAQSLDNKDRDIEKELIYCMQDTQKIEKAEAYAKKYKKDADSMEFLARVYYSYGDKEKGLTLLEESLKKYPKEPSLYNLKVPWLVTVPLVVNVYVSSSFKLKIIVFPVDVGVSLICPLIPPEVETQVQSPTKGSMSSSSSFLQESNARNANVARINFLMIFILKSKFKHVFYQLFNEIYHLCFLL